MTSDASAAATIASIKSRGTMQSASTKTRRSPRAARAPRSRPSPGPLRSPPRARPSRSRGHEALVDALEAARASFHGIVEGGLSRGFLHRVAAAQAAQDGGRATADVVRVEEGPIDAFADELRDRAVVRPRD